MQIGFVKENNDARVALTPDVAKKFVAEKRDIILEQGAGEQAHFSDAEYTNAGAKTTSRAEVLSGADMIISVNPLTKADYAQLKKGAIVISQFTPYNDDSILADFVAKKQSVYSMDMIPRTTLAQAMDVLSSMASVAGYKAVLKAADHLPRYFPMLTTAAGSIPPSKVLVLGAGVAGLQAIATAKRLGARVEAFDTRAASKEEVESLGAKFVEVEGAVDDKAAGGYAVEQSDEFKAKQQAKIKERIIQSDVVITTALLRGRPAPKLVTEEMIKQMKPGSVIVDIASSMGGNTDLTKDKEVVKAHGVTIVGDADLAAGMPQNSSLLFAKNVQNFLAIFFDAEGNFTADFENEIIKGSNCVNAGEITFGK
jgi:NAD(P) transhydrogenase subunit alpha